VEFILSLLTEEEEARPTFTKIHEKLLNKKIPKAEALSSSTIEII